MNKIIFVVATLAICALPGAFGLMCYNCTAMAPWNTPNERCMNESAYMPENCTDQASHCATVMLMANDVMVYSAGCVAPMQNCSTYNMTTCAAVQAGGGAAITSCTTECCNTDKCNMPTFPTDAPSTTATTAGDTETTPTSGIEFFGPKVIALLAAYLLALHFGKQ